MSAIEVTQLLRQWELRLRDLGAPAVEGLRPGLTRQEVDALGAEFRVTLPDEAAAIWMWHDGDTGPSDVRGLTPYGPFVDLRSSLEQSRSLQRITFDGDDDGDYSDEDPGYELYFRRDYLILLGGPGPLYLDCTPGLAGMPTAAYLSHDCVPAPRVELVERLHNWHQALDTGLWAIRADGSWLDDETHAPDEQTWQWLYRRASWPSWWSARHSPDERIWWWLY